MLALQATETGISFRGAGARTAPASAFKRAAPAAASTPLKTAAARTGMAAFSGVPPSLFAAGGTLAWQVLQS